MNPLQAQFDGGAVLSFPDYPDPPAALRVRVQMMSDPRGTVQVITPPDTLLDLERLRALTQRDLRPQRYTTAALATAVPGAAGTPVIVEETLLSGEAWALATGEPEGFVRASGPELMGGPIQVQLGRFCHPVGAEPTPECREGDMTRIRGTLSRFTERRIQQRLDQTLHIPPLPTVAQQVMRLKADPDCELRDLVRVIEADPSIAARIMGWANSAFYRPDPPPRGIADAINRVLGLNTTMSMALGLAFGQVLRLPDTQVRGLPPFWLEAVFTAGAMDALAHGMRGAVRIDPDDAYLVGLLANFGTLVVGHVFPHQYRTMCLLQEANRHLPHTYVDQHVLELPREVIAAALLESWDLPRPLTDAVRYQYLPDYRGDNATYVHLLQVTRALLAAEGLTDCPPRIPGDAELAALGLDRDRLEVVRTRLRESAGEIDGAVSLLDA